MTKALAGTIAGALIVAGALSSLSASADSRFPVGSMLRNCSGIPCDRWANQLRHCGFVVVSEDAGIIDLRLRCAVLVTDATGSAETDNGVVLAPDAGP